ncbi:hypothetical protein CCR75_000909 [Bremia lactucae]|uniref:Uncharacterized protein n=1 Tax=Bremia lactucae TaxID=4779 RepID=A0A976IEK1_BRELC|nr:hypothetical protein CCR75_000909 [Bremia lactucae]
MPVNLEISSSKRFYRRYGGGRLPYKVSALLASLFLAIDHVHGQLSSTSLRLLKTTLPQVQNHEPLHRALAQKKEISSYICNNKDSFLGVGNTECLNENLDTAIFLLSVIILVSLFLDRLVHHIRAAIKCPQLALIVDRIFEEVMILGFISMVIFTINTSGAIDSLDLNDLTAYEQLHFYEFFHYIVFLTVVYFIAIVLLLLFIGTVAPKLVWEIQQQHADHRRESISDIHDDTYASRRPSDRDERQSQSRESRVRKFSFYSSGSTYLDDSEQTGTTPHDDYEDTARGVQPSRVHRSVRTPTRPRSGSGMDLVMGSLAYSLLLQRYQSEGWWAHLNVCRQWNLYKSFEILAYNICQNRSGYIYKNPKEMQRLFGVEPPLERSLEDDQSDDSNDDDEPMTYARYHILCMRNLLYHMTNIPLRVFVVLIVLCLLPSIFPDQDHWIFLSVGIFLLFLNVLIFVKVLQILRGIVDDRLHIITSREIQSRLTHVSKKPRPRHRLRGSVDDDIDEENDVVDDRRRKALMRFKTAALAVRALIRMQMSALCHRQLHHHNDRFWFQSPKFLLRLFQLATIGQAFYLVWLSLVEINSVRDSSPGEGGGPEFLVIMIVLPILALFVITPLTMPSLVLVMSLTGIYVELNAKNQKGTSHTKKHNTPKDLETHIQTHTRLIRRSFLRSSHSEHGGGGYRTPNTPPLEPRRSSLAPEMAPPSQQNLVPSPSEMFLRVYDSPANARRHSYRAGASIGRDHPLGRWKSNSRSGDSFCSASGEDNERNSFNLAAFQLMSSPMTTTNEEYFPPTSGNSFSSTTSSAYKSPRDSKMDKNSSIPSKSWSQANVAPDIQGYNERESLHEQGMTPRDPSFKSFCSKYGGYPDA